MKITVYSTSWCGPCNNAKQLLNSRGLDFTEVDIEEIGWTRDDLFEKRAHLLERYFNHARGSEIVFRRR